MTDLKLPIPQLEEVAFGSLKVLTDNALARQTGVRVAFSGRSGGVSEGPYGELNLGDHVDDDYRAVLQNRSLLLHALAAGDMRLLNPKQVHGTEVVTVLSAEAEALDAAETAIRNGADGIVSGVSDVAVLLCFADCVPIIIVSPTGAFAVVHAGWRGVEASIVLRAIERLQRCDSTCFDRSVSPSEYNVYVGPHIHTECFETGDDVRARFVNKFGEASIASCGNVDLLAALKIDLASMGVSMDRVVDAGICTLCRPDEFFSYRASGGVCGRHGALAFREERASSWE